MDTTNVHKSYKTYVTPWDARQQIAFMIEPLNEEARRQMMDQVMDRYYYSDEKEQEARLALTGEEQRKALEQDLMNYFYPGIYLGE